MNEREIARAAKQIEDDAAREAYIASACGENHAARRRVEALLLGPTEDDPTTVSETVAPRESTLIDPPVLDEGRTAAYGEPAASPGSPGGGGTATEPLSDDRTTEISPGKVGTDTEPSAPETVIPDADEPGATEPPFAGRVVAGRYELTAVLGEGGMGTVYRARQTHPVKRNVALKLIRTYLPSPMVIARFEAERQALALMDHPNIARVFDGGLTEAGEPYFVMELVDGEPVTTFCDQRRLTLRARLELFIGICSAVNHAHQKGIIHRDLKPGNVLVTLVDGRPTPKVIDFGVAKAVEVAATDISFSDTGLIVGTPSYMSPEQADPSSMSIDTRTDVYALGVILYELLVGSPPLDARDFRRAAVMEILRMVREVDPPRPSTKLRTAPNLPNIAAVRNTRPEQLARSLEGELDWVVMKAIEKDRERRYAGPLDLARDLERYLADELVEARPPSRSYRLRKFARRNRFVLAASGILFLALAAGVVGTSLGLIEARRQRDSAEKGWAKAEENFTAARELILSMGNQINQFESSQRDPKLADVARRRALEEARDQFDKFRLGRLDDVSLQRQAALLHRYTATISMALSDYPAANRAYGEAIKITEQLAKRHPEDAVHGLDLALALGNRAMLEMRMGKLGAADETLASAVRLAAEPCPDSLATPQTRTVGLLDYDRSKIAYFLGRFDDSLRFADDSLRYLDRLKDAPADKRQAFDALFAVTAVSAIAKARRELGRAAEAFPMHDEAVRRMSLLAGKTPDRHQTYWINEARLERARTAAGFPERRAAALDDLNEPLALAQRQIEDFPHVAIYHEQLAAILLCRGELLTLLGKAEQATAELARSLAVSRVLLDRFGVLTGSMLVRGRSFLALARASALAGKAADAETNRKNAAKVFEIALRIDPENVFHRRGLREASDPVGPTPR